MPLLSEANRRKRNLFILAGFVLLVGTANLLDIGVYAPDLPLVHASGILQKRWAEDDIPREPKR